MRNFKTIRRGTVMVQGSRSKRDTAFEMGYSKGFFGKDIPEHYKLCKDFLYGYNIGKQDRAKER